MRIKQSLCFPIFPVGESDLGPFFRELKRIGYTGVEFWGRDSLDDFESVVAQANESSLAVVSMVGHSSLTDGFNKRENHDRIEAELRESIDVAVAHGIGGLICFSGNRNPGQSDYDGLLACAEGLKRIAPYAEEQGVNLNVELLNSRIDHPGYQCDHTEWGVALCTLVDSRRIKLLYDIYHMQIMEGDIMRTITTHAAVIGHMHTAGNPGRMDLHDEQELNYGAVCNAIAASGYDGYVGHEFKPKGDPIESARAAFNLCNRS